MSFSEEYLDEFASSIAAGSPTPGGGSVAAIGGAFGAALGEMVCNLTAGNDEYDDVAEDLTEIREDLTRRRRRLLELADEDSEAFDEVMTAFKTPEGEGRKAAIEEASKLAATVPLETAENCLGVVEASVTIAEKGNTNSVTDAGTGALMAYAGLQAALYNVEINLGSIGDEEFLEEIEHDVIDLRQDARNYIAEVNDTVSNSI